MKQALRRGVGSVAMGLLLSGFLWASAPPVHAATCPVTYTADGRPTIAPTGAGPGTGKIIGFDVTHGQTAGQADWVIDGGFSDMACALAGQGYAVEEIRSYPLTQPVLDAFDAVVIPEPNIPFTTAEQQSLEGYVAAGGGLLLIGDHYQADRNYNTWDATEIFNGFRRGHSGQAYSAPAYNYNGVATASPYLFNNGNDWLASAFGFRYRFNAMDLASASNAFGPGDPADPDDPGILPPDATYGITTGVSRVATYAGATISIVDPARAMGVIYPNQGTLKRWNNAQSNDPVALYTDNVGIPAGGAATYGGRAEGAYVVVAKPGAGKVAAAGDSSLWEDGSPKYRKETDGTAKSTHDGWLDSDHDTLGLNLIQWLTTPDANAGIDPALRQEATPEPYSPFTLAEPLSEPWANPPSGYLWYDARTFRAGAYNGSNTGSPPQVGESWQWESVSLNAYPNNNPAVFLSVVGLTPNATSTNQAYIYASGGTQISYRYFRETNEYKGGSNVAATQQTLPVDSEGRLQRWEFWRLDNATSARTIQARVRVGSTNKATTTTINQKPTSGTYGYLKVESALGYSDGVHAALFTTGTTLDTAVQIKQGADTSITLAPGSYMLEIRNDTTVKRTGVPLTIVAGQTLSLAQVLAGGGGNPNARFTFSSVPEFSYPGNRLAIYLDGQDLAVNTGYTTAAYATPAGGAQAVSRRFNRSSGLFETAAAQTLTANGAGEVHRWEFWEVDQAPSPRLLSAKVQVNGTETDVQEITQAAGGTYGYLTVESALGFADGLHAALFRAGATLDTAVWLAPGADTTVTLPPGTYTLEVRNDTAAPLSGVSVAITEGQTVSLAQLLGGGQPEASWFLNSVPAHVYPGNRLALRLDALGLPAAKTYSTRGYAYVTGSGTQISRRYNRSSQTFVDGLTYQSLTTDGSGEIHRWEFWDLTNWATRGISARLVVDGTRWATVSLQQVGTGAFGFLTVPASLGYSDGLHAALFTTGGVLDTTAWIARDADTTITLPAGTYSLAIWNDVGPVIANLPLTVEAGQSISLAHVLDSTPPTISAVRAPEPNAAGWNNSPVTVTFACEDEGSGIASCSEAVTLTGEGRGQSATGIAVDKAGNTASLTVGEIHIDMTAPDLAVTGARVYGVDEEVSVTCTAADGLSGLAEDPCAAPLASGSAAAFGLGTHSVAVTAVDKAGNAASATAEFSVAVTYESLIALTERLVGDSGVVNGLVAKLSVAQAAAERGNTKARDGALEAFINQVQAQGGKAITAEQAEMLVALAGGLSTAAEIR